MVWPHSQAQVQVGTGGPRHCPGPFSGLSKDTGCPHLCSGSSWETTAPIWVSSVKRTLVYCKQKQCCISPPCRGSAIRLPAAPAPAAAQGWGMWGHHTQPSHIHLVSLGDPELLLRLYQHLSEINEQPCSWGCPLGPGAGGLQHCPWLALLNAAPLCLWVSAGCCERDG